MCNTSWLVQDYSPVFRQTCSSLLDSVRALCHYVHNIFCVKWEYKVINKQKYICQSNSVVIVLLLTTTTRQSFFSLCLSLSLSLTQTHLAQSPSVFLITVNELVLDKWTCWRLCVGWPQFDWIVLNKHCLKTFSHTANSFPFIYSILFVLILLWWTCGGCTLQIFKCLLTRGVG